MSHNRILRPQPDYILAVVRKPAGWQPRRIDDVPPGGEVMSSAYVASYEEALGDVKRCNEFALSRNLNEWAVILCTAADL